MQYVESDQITYPAVSGSKQSQKPNMGKWHLLHNQATHRNDEFLWKTSVVQIKHTLLYEQVTKSFSVLSDLITIILAHSIWGTYIQLSEGICISMWLFIAILIFVMFEKKQ